MPSYVRKVSSANLKLDVRLVELALLAPMSFHLDVQNDNCMLSRAQKKISDKNKSRRNGKITNKHGAETGKHENTRPK